MTDQPELPLGEQGRALSLHNGTFTVAHPTRGHYTVKLHTVTNERSKLHGRRLFSLLTGPSNEDDYQGVAFWFDEEERAGVWSRHRSDTSPSPQKHPVNGWHWSRHWSKVEKKLAVMLDLALRGDRGYWSGQGYTLHLEGRCCICNRKLTTPESITSGIGPVCAARRA